MRIRETKTQTKSSLSELCFSHTYKVRDRKTRASITTVFNKHVDKLPAPSRLFLLTALLFPKKGGTTAIVQGVARAPVIVYTCTHSRKEERVKKMSPTSCFLGRFLEAAPWHFCLYSISQSLVTWTCQIAKRSLYSGWPCAQLKEGSNTWTMRGIKSGGIVAARACLRVMNSRGFDSVFL